MRLSLDKIRIFMYLIGMETKESKKRTQSHGAWFRNEIAVMQGRRAFTPEPRHEDKGCTNKQQSLGPTGNSVVSDTL